MRGNTYFESSLNKLIQNEGSRVIQGFEGS